MWGKIIKEAVGVMLIALFLSGAAYALRPVFTSTGTSGQDDAGAGGEGSGYGAISLEDARNHFENDTALFADARSSGAYSQGRVRGAMHLDPHAFDNWSGDFFARISPDQTIIAYCDGAQCGLSRDLAEKLVMMGYEKVFYLKDGWALWKQHQLPIEQGDP